jgi:hypothetical protein
LDITRWPIRHGHADPTAKDEHKIHPASGRFEVKRAMASRMRSRAELDDELGSGKARDGVTVSETMMLGYLERWRHVERMRQVRGD